MALCLLSYKQISRAFLLRQNLNRLDVVSSRALNISVPRHFPRGVKMKEILEDEEALDDWNQFMARRSKSWDQESKIETRFGSVRVDSDNIALYHGQNEEHDESALHPAPEEERKIGDFKHVRSDIKSDEGGELLEALLFEGNMNPEFFKPKEFVVKRKTEVRQVVRGKETKPFLAREQSKENFTIPIDFDKEYIKPKEFGHQFINDLRHEQTKQNKESQRNIESTGDEVSDLNYFDSFAFGEAFKNFSSGDSNNEHSVKFDQEIIDDARRQFSEAGLNEIDKEFFGRSLDADKDVSDSDLSKSYRNEIDKEFFGRSLDANKVIHETKIMNHLSSEDVTRPGGENNDLNYIDEQSFPITSASQNETESLKEPLTLIPFAIKPIENKSDSLSTKDENAEKTKPNTKKEKKNKGIAHPKPSPALDYVRKLRKTNASEQKQKEPSDLIGVNLQARLSAVTIVDQPIIKAKDNHESNPDPEDQQFLPVSRFCPPILDKYTSLEVTELLLSKIIYDDHDIVALWKPYGLPMFATEDGVYKTKARASHNLEKYLPKLAAKLNCERLHEVHRLDKTTTGVVIFARTEHRRKHLKELFAKKKISKTYLALVNGTPQPTQGIINIPISDGRIGDKFRKTLRPDYAKATIVSNKKNFKGNVSPAVTEYRTLGSHGKASLVEVKMLSGVKHQVRIHLGLGLSTPVLGDHKYSYADQLGKPQRVYGDIVSRMKVKRSKTRDLPIFLHARSIHIPEIFPDRDLWINANLPHFFSRALKTLKLKHSFN